MLTYIPTNCLYLFTHNLNTYNAFTYTFCFHYIYMRSLFLPSKCIRSYCLHVIHVYPFSVHVDCLLIITYQSYRTCTCI